MRQISMRVLICLIYKGAVLWLQIPTVPIGDITLKLDSMIRKREEKDNDEIMNVWNQASILAHPFLEPDFVEKAKKDLRDVYIPNTETWVFEENSKVIGFISMLGNEIGGLFVLPNNHRKGVGTQLVNFINRLYPELEVEVFEKNVIGRAFYEKYGFTLIRRYHHADSNNEILRLRYEDSEVSIQ